MKYKVVHKIDGQPFTHLDAIDCWCKPYVVTLREAETQQELKNLIDRQDMIDLFARNPYPN